MKIMTSTFSYQEERIKQTIKIMNNNNCTFSIIFNSKIVQNYPFNNIDTNEK